MGKRENKIESYLQQQILTLGGDTRKFVSPGHVGVPDQIVMIKGIVWFVETKTVDGRLSSAQYREQNRLHALGMRVTTVWSKQEVDKFIIEVMHATGLMPPVY